MSDIVKLTRGRASVGKQVLACVAGGAVLLAAAQASAATTCNGLPGTVLIGAGGSAQLPLVQAIAEQLAVAPTPVTIVYSSSGSACAGYADLIAGSVTGSANYWDANGLETCQFDTTLVAKPTFAVMGNAPNLCPSTTGLAAGYGQFLGPAQPVDFVVPAKSSQQSISTAAVFDVFGYAAASGSPTVSPWTIPANILTRSATSFVNIFTALDTGIPSQVIASSGATVEATNSATLAALVTLNGTAPESSIGFVSGEVADGDRTDVRILAYQHTGQSCGYWPDSSVDAYDKVNVRSGQYWLWSPVHFFAAVDSNNNITDPGTASFIGLFTGATAEPTGVDVFAASDQAFTVPQCAMQAWRDGDLAAPYSFAPPNPCSCKFDIIRSNAHKPTSCQTCSQDSDCSTQHCRNITAGTGYCEAY